MSYTVRFLPDAEQELAELWMDSSKRDSVTQAAHRIDKQLMRDPEQLGESRSQDCRIFFEPPLAVLFRVLVGSQLVEVVHLWEFD